MPLPSLHPGLQQALAARGITQLYDHQLEALQGARSRHHVVIATPTASGKSLCFHLPVVEALVDDRHASALFLYPTKALSRDQEHAFHSLLADASFDTSIPTIVFDGDTPGDVRQKARHNGRVILTNPDMLHSGILPNHNKWASFFQGLQYVVLDEMHTYRGIFGSHMAHVIARLKRICAFHGSSPTFIGATATIGNPREHACRLLGTPASTVKLVERSGAPQSRRQVFIYNPPIVNEDLGVRGSSLKAAVRLAGDMVQAKVPTILFGPSRNSVEVMLKYLRQRCVQTLQDSGIDVNRAIMGYRGGYLPAMRRDIERGLRTGEILCVVATNALELGIDIGDLDCVICAGYPGSVAGTWQRFGRAGRRGKSSALVLVCGSGAIDQYLASTPEYLLEGSAEQALIDPQNTEILIQHLKCAAFEAPFVLSAPGPRLSAPKGAEGEAYAELDADSTRDALEYLRGLGLLHATSGKYHWSGEAFPASHVSLRNIGWDNFVIIERETPHLAEATRTSSEKTIGELDYRATHTMLHVQAIYQQDAEQYQVEHLDFDNHKAYVRRVEPDYFTTALTYRTVDILDPFDERGFLCEQPTTDPNRDPQALPQPLPQQRSTEPPEHPERRNEVALGTVARAPDEPSTDSRGDSLASQPPSSRVLEGWGDVKVLEKVTGYKKIKFFTHENAGYGDVHLPEMEMHTTSYWLTLPETFIEEIGMARPLVIEALRSIGRALETVATVHLMCDPRDINRTVGDSCSKEAGARSKTLFLFDSAPGGVGLAERIYRCLPELLEQARALIAACSCENGCPACIGPPGEVEPGKQPTSATLARAKANPLGSNEVFAPTVSRREQALTLIRQFGILAQRQLH